MNLIDANAIFIDIQKFHANTIVPLMNGSTFPIGKTFDIPLQNQNYVAKFVVYSDDKTPYIWAEKERQEGTKWSLDIFSVSGGEPFRIEEKPNQIVHINTADKNFNHIPLLIPAQYLYNYGILGSAAMGYFEPSDGQTLPQLLKTHFDALK